MRTMLIGAVMLLACPIITLIAGGWCASVSCADDKGDKTSEQAKAICEKFNKAFFANDVDAAMKLVATPWFDNYGEKGNNIRKDAAVEGSKTSVGNVNRRRGANLYDALEGPTTQNREGESIGCRCRDIVGQARRKCVPNVKV